MFINKIRTRLKWKRKQDAWRVMNMHNETFLKNNFFIEHVKVGNYTYGELCVIDYAAEEYSTLEIGSFCSIASNVTFVLNGEHRIDTLTSYPVDVKILQKYQYCAFGKGNIIVGDDVWIGNGATILSNVSIGQGAVVAAGALVAKNIPPYAIVGGVPARVIRYRFPENIRNQLVKLDLTNITRDEIKENETLFLNSIDETFFESNLYWKHIRKEDGNSD